MLKHKGTVEISTERLILRKFRYDDVDDMLKYWVSDPLVQLEYCEPVYESSDEVNDLLKKIIENYTKEEYYRWAIVCKETNECIGQIAFFLVDSKNNFAEIEYCISRQFQKRGLATEATKAIIEFGFKEVKFHKIQICHKEDNTASNKVINKCGFVYEGMLRDYFYINEKYVSRLYYSILDFEFLNSTLKERRTTF